METVTLEQMGLDQDELQQRLVEAIVNSVMASTGYDEDGDPYPRASGFAKGLRDKLQEALDAQVQAIAEEHVIPRVGEMIENATLQRTNEWGEKAGEPKTFTQYLVQRAEDYLMEPVDYQGKSLERGSYQSRKTQTRLAHLVDRHLHYGIESAMKQAVKDANDVLASALAETARLKLREIAEQLKINVEPCR